MSLNYCKHVDFVIKAGTTFVETDRPRNYQLVVGGEWHDIEAVHNFQAIRCLPGGIVDKVKIAGALTQAADIPSDLESAFASVRDVPRSISAYRLGTNLELWLWTPLAVIMFLVQLVLEVFGGVGAVWGCAEVLRLRIGFNLAWHSISEAVGIICLARFFVVRVLASDRSFLQGHPHFSRLTLFWKFQAVCRSPSSFLFQCQ
jgi:hypothetical protein